MSIDLLIVNISHTVQSGVYTSNGVVVLSAFCAQSQSPSYEHYYRLHKGHSLSWVQKDPRAL